MRNMSFMLTTAQVRDGTKTVTRRLGWEFLKPGDLVRACVKCMGLRRGEHVERIRTIRILRVSKQWLNSITQEDVQREGFPDWTPQQFVNMFCEHNHCEPDTLVNRIEFEYVDGFKQEAR